LLSGATAANLIGLLVLDSLCATIESISIICFGFYAVAIEMQMGQMLLNLDMERAMALHRMHLTLLLLFMLCVNVFEM
jgi:glucan phosphoethanolaminetransferase (alkaline phosphatase superfamily)